MYSIVKQRNNYSFLMIEEIRKKIHTHFANGTQTLGLPVNRNRTNKFNYTIKSNEKKKPN